MSKSRFRRVVHYGRGSDPTIEINVRVHTYDGGSLTQSETDSLADYLTDKAVDAIHSAPYVNVPRYKIVAKGSKE